MFYQHQPIETGVTTLKDRLLLYIIMNKNNNKSLQCNECSSILVSGCDLYLFYVQCFIQRVDIDIGYHRSSRSLFLSHYDLCDCLFSPLRIQTCVMREVVTFCTYEVAQ